MDGLAISGAEEASIHPLYKNSVVACSEDDTVYTTLFDIGWPDAPHRVISNSTYKKWQASGCPASSDRPGEAEEAARTASGWPVIGYGDSLAVPRMTGDLEALPMYEGQSIGLVSDIAPAGEIVKRIVQEATESDRK